MPLVREALEAGTNRHASDRARDDGDGARRPRPQLPGEVLHAAAATLEAKLRSPRAAKAGKGNLVPVYREVTADLETPVSAFLKVRSRPVLVPARIGRGRRTAGALLVHRHRALPRDAHRPGRGVGRRPAHPARGGDWRASGRCPSRACRRSPAAPSVTWRTTQCATSSLAWSGRSKTPLDIPEVDVPVLRFACRLRPRPAHAQGDRALPARRRHRSCLCRRACVASTRSSTGSPIPTVPSPKRNVASGPRSQNGKARVERRAAKATWAMVDRIREYVDRRRRHPGGAIARLARPTAVHPFNIYRQMRTVNPSPYMFFLDMGDFQVRRSFTRTARQGRERRVSPTRSPGTRPRAATSEEEDRASRKNCWRTKRSAPSTSCSWTSAATTLGAWPRPAR